MSAPDANLNDPAPKAAPEPADDGRLHHALLAYVRQEFEAPSLAIVGYAELILDETERYAIGDRAADIERILQAGRDLHRLIDSLLHPETAAARGARSGDGAAAFDAFSAQLRHDLRTPINAVKGYGEMLLEDARDADEAALVQDLEHVVEAADGLLAEIDALVRFADPGGADDAALAAMLPSAAGAEAVATVLQALQPSTLSPEARAERAQYRILVVDDTASARDLLARQLGRDGYAVEEAADGPATLARLAQARDIDLVLLDLMMPGMSGYEVLTRMKADAVMREVPVIMISAFDDFASIVRCIEAGAEDYLPKPFNPVLLRARLGASLERKHLADLQRRTFEDLQAEREKTEGLLRNILPAEVVARIRDRGETMIADGFESVTMLFADLVGFTVLSSRLTPADLVSMLNGVFSRLDHLCAEIGVEKIKTIGDCYMVAGGLPGGRKDHACAVAEFAIAMHRLIDEINAATGSGLRFRIGMHTGPVIAGIIGTRKFAYDVWGDTVNTASRMESHGAPERIHVSHTVYAELRDRFRFEPRGPIDVKGKGVMETYFLLDTSALGETEA